MMRRKRIILTIAMVAAILVVLVIARVIIINSWQPASTVDVSPLEQLTAEQIGRIDEIWERLEQHGHIHWSYTDEGAPHSDMLLRHRFLWYKGERSGDISPSSYRPSPSPFTHLDVTVRIYPDEATAIDSMQWRRVGLRESPGGHIAPLPAIIANDNNTEAALFPASIDPIFIGWDSPLRASYRLSPSQIRIGHVVIRILESRPWYNFWDDNSGRLIALVVETLQEE